MITSPRFSIRSFLRANEALLNHLIEGDGELEHYARSARIAVTGNPD